MSEIPSDRGLSMEENSNSSHGVILMADSDLDYHLIIQCTLEEVGFRGMVQGVSDGDELMEYLHRRGKYNSALTPDLIILDLNMPERDGRSALLEIKSDPSLHRIPVVVMTNSASEQDIHFCSRFRKCSFSRKPVSFAQWTRKFQDILTENFMSWRPADPLPEKESDCRSEC